MADNVTLPGTGEVIATDQVGGFQYQRVKAVWGADGVATDVEAVNPLPTSVNASIFRFSTNNSSSAELAANATFTGTLETALDQPSISLLMTSDQPMTLTIYQYIDISGVYAVTPIVYTVPASQGFSASFALNGNYVKVTAKNIGTATTTTFELNTAYGSLPAADFAGRLPVSTADCVTLLSQSLSAVGASTTIDTLGYASVIVQLSGVWQGAGYFETSNTNAVGDWASTFVLATDSASVQDVVTGKGVYTVTPTGRYLRFTLTSLTGATTLTALGRSSVGIDPSDMLSLAMDKANNMPLNVAINGVKQDAQGALILSDAVPYYATASAASATIPVFTGDTTGYNSVTVSGIGGTGVAIVSFSDSIAGPWTNASGYGYLNSNSQPVFLGTGAVTFTANASGASQFPVLGKYIRVVISAVTVAPCVLAITMRTAPCFAPVPLFSSNGTVNCNISTGTVTATSTQPFTPTASIISSTATTNATAVKASAGTIYRIECANSGAAAAFVKLHNSASAPTVGTTAVNHIIAVPASGNASFDGGVLGMRYGTGIALSITNLIADTDATAVAANQVKVNISYV